MSVHKVHCVASLAYRYAGGTWWFTYGRHEILSFRKKNSRPVGMQD